MQLEHKILDVDGEKLVCEFALSEKNAVILHGAGQSQRKRYYAIAQELNRHKIGVVMFDFSGHGESTGTLEQLSLSRRKKQAKAVIEKIIPAESLLYLVGFSMGAQTVCDLLPDFGNRTLGILLACPAIYRADVQNLPFGTDTFTSKLREQNSWRATNATKYLANFSGKTVVAIGSNDAVIPKGVISLLKSSAQHLIYREYKGATHAFAPWLTDNPKELSELISVLT